jgi:flagellar biosynthesis/type III secretory pathway chaperone
VDQHACRAHLARLLTDEAALLAQLDRQLLAEHELLKSSDVDGLEQAGSARQDTISRLMRIEDERTHLCRMLGRGSDKTGLAALFAWCDPQGGLATAQSECAQLAARCRVQNERNGALVTARLKRVTGMLDMLADGSTPRTYQPRASHYAAPPAGRMVSISA